MAVKSHWSEEKARFALIALFGLIIGFVIGRVWLGLAVTFMLYCAWLLHQAGQVDNWLQKGSRRDAAPDTSGVIGHIEQLIYRRKQSDKDRKAKLKKIVGWYNRSAAALPDATVVTNDNYEIQWANDAAKAYLGILAHRDQGQRIDNLVRNPSFQSYVQDKSQENEEIEIKSPVNAAITLVIRRVAYAENLYLFSARDVSQRVQLRATRSAFVANASHELKTPLTVVNGYLELLLDDKTLSDSAQKKVRLASEHANRMSDIVTDLLTLSRLENQGIDSKKLQPLNVASMLKSTAEDLSSLRSGLEHNFDVSTDDNLLLNGSEVEIKSVCTNLCHNAIQHTAPGSTITMSWQETSGGGALLVVGDNGQGIDPKDLPHVTERFYRADSIRSRETGGTGLGLSIVKHIVHRHQGELTIMSTPWAGTEVSIRFPADQIRTAVSTDNGNPDDEKSAGIIPFPSVSGNRFAR